MADKHWKQFERRVASFFGSVRNALSGGNSKVSRSDSLHKNLFLECKHHARIAILTEYTKYLILARKEGKRLVMALANRGCKGFYLLIKDEDLIPVALERQRVLKAQREANETK